MNVRRIGLLGDVHAEDALLAHALAFLRTQDVDAIFCTGDLVDGEGCVDACVRLLQEHDTVCVRGNHDRWLLDNRVRNVPDAHRRETLSSQTVEFLESLPSQVEFQTPLGPGLLCHGVADDDLAKVWPGSKRMPAERNETLDEMLASNTLRFLINGHMHYRSLVYFQSMTLINAGTLKSAHRPGFSMVDFDHQRIDAFEFSDGACTQVRHRPLEPQPTQQVWASTAEFSGVNEPIGLYPPDALPV